MTVEEAYEKWLDKVINRPDFQEEDMAYVYSLDYLTCGRCDKYVTCKFAFDPYNTDGDCLADK